MEIATSPISFGPVSTAAKSSTASAPAWLPRSMQASAQPDGSRAQGQSLQASDMSTLWAHQPFSMSQSPSHERAESGPDRSVPRQQSSPGEHIHFVEVALTSELVARLLRVSQAVRTHDSAGGTEPLQAKGSESAQQLDATSKGNDSHTRIMELQVCSPVPQWCRYWRRRHRHKFWQATALIALVPILNAFGRFSTQHERSAMHRCGLRRNRQRRPGSKSS